MSNEERKEVIVLLHGVIKSLERVGALLRNDDGRMQKIAHACILLTTVAVEISSDIMKEQARS